MDRPSGTLAGTGFRPRRPRAPGRRAARAGASGPDPGHFARRGLPGARTATGPGLGPGVVAGRLASGSAVVPDGPSRARRGRPGSSAPATRRGPPGRERLGHDVRRGDPDEAGRPHGLGRGGPGRAIGRSLAASRGDRARPGARLIPPPADALAEPGTPLARTRSAPAGRSLGSGRLPELLESTAPGRVEGVGAADLLSLRALRGQLARREAPLPFVRRGPLEVAPLLVRGRREGALSAGPLRDLPLRLEGGFRP